MGASFGRGGATGFLQDLQNADCIVIQGSNMAECHPVGFQWVMEAKARGATIIHVDPRFTRTSAVADMHVPLRAGSDIVFLGAIVNYILSNETYFHDYVLAYTNAAMILREDFRDVDDLDGVFSGYDPETGHLRHQDLELRGCGAGTRRPPARRSRSGTPPADGGGNSDESEESHEGTRRPGHELGGHGAEHAGHRRAAATTTLQHPRCVFQVLKRHYARYTPEMVQEVCGVPPEQFLKVCEAVTSQQRARADHRLGVLGRLDAPQRRRAVHPRSAIIQLLLGNMGRPGGGIMALRGHASIQGSTDIPTLFNLLPGYLPMPTVARTTTLQRLPRAPSPRPTRRASGPTPTRYTVEPAQGVLG